MIVLGWHGGVVHEYEDAAPGWSTHDAAAVLIRDGEIICAVEDERLSRIKHSNFFPARAIQRSLEIGGIEWNAVDRVAMNFAERPRDTFSCDAGVPSIDGFLEDPERRCYSVKEFICDLFRREFGVDIYEKLFFCSHHEAHLWSAFTSSGFAESLIVSLDGSGDCLSGMVATGTRDGLQVLRRLPVEQSLGNLYSDLIRFLGYRRFDEYKAMGLAPYGDPTRFKSLFERLYRLLPDGEFELADRRERWSILHENGVLPLARRAGQPFTQDHKDFAAALQAALESAAIHAISDFRVKSRQENLCFAGGVAHNSALNGRLLREGLFSRMFVQPAAHDAGGALGAAMAAYHHEVRPAHRPLKHLFHGGEIGNERQVSAALQAWGKAVDLMPVANPAFEAARLLAQGKIVGWVQGRSEFGPRALGHRSILADPCPPENGARINAAIKNRESFRPFAPSILEEEVNQLVEMPACRADLSFMTYVLQVSKSARGMLGAVTHVDGSARIQTVSRNVDPLYWSLINEFRKITGVPAVLNTSFNNDAEPIVDSVNDAVSCFLTTDLDALIIDRFMVMKSALPLAECLAPLHIVCPPSRKLVRRARSSVAGMGAHFSIDSTASRHFAQTSIPISRAMFYALVHADLPLRVEEAFPSQGAGAQNNRDILREELIGLWRRRAVWLVP